MGKFIISQKLHYAEKSTREHLEDLEIGNVYSIRGNLTKAKRKNIQALINDFNKSHVGVYLTSITHIGTNSRSVTIVITKQSKDGNVQ